MMGVTRERIRQLRDRALKQLKEQHGDRLKDLAA
jgi:DNA-directed RNA polymerase sigma subunit (sigma70/sigma32)